MAGLPTRFSNWFSARGWSARGHQLRLIELAEAGRDALLVAPTGAGKTLAGFLPSLVDLAARPANRRRLHTLYVSPLKALAVDVARNLDQPIADMGLPIRVETRTGDTPAARRQRQRRLPPDILLTTPEQLALLLASADARTLFADLRRVVLDELHALALSKRGDLLALGLARLRRLAPGMSAAGLSATVREPRDLARFLCDARGPEAELVLVSGGARPRIEMLDAGERTPWAGHGARHAIGAVYEALSRARLTLIFVNTRSQAERAFQDLWRVNEAGFPIALHHGSLDVGQRRKVEAAMAAGRLKAVVCTSTLDLGIDWGDVDLVIHIGAPKGASRLTQRIGRANHRLEEASRALLVPANRFEALECVAAIEAVAKGAQDTPAPRPGALDVLAQHILGMACAEPFDADALFQETTSAAPYASLAREDFDAALDFAATGGYALRAYERFAKIRRARDGSWRIANPGTARRYRMNVGTIVEETMLKVRLAAGRRGRGAGGRALAGPLTRGGRVLGEIEEYFLTTLSPGDTFLFAGEVLALRGVVENEAIVARASGAAPKVPSYTGGKFPLSTFLAGGVRRLLADPSTWPALPGHVGEWLALQREFSILPPADRMLVETFPRHGRHFLVAYPFEGRLAHQSLGMLLTRRMERGGLRPLGFVASDYALAIWGLADVGARIADGLVSLDALFAQDMLGDDLEEWLQESAMMKRMFRACAIIAGMIERRTPGKEKTSRQMTVSTDLIYDVLRGHQPDHILLRAARSDAATGLLDLERVAENLSRIAGRIMHKRLDRVSPLAVPVLVDIGVEPIDGEAREAILAGAAEDLMEEAVGAAGRKR